MLAGWGFVVPTMGDTVPNPNFIEGGYTYYYGTVEGNTPDNPDNTLGRPPTKLRNFEPTNGHTNVAYVCYEDLIGISSGWAMAKNADYTGTNTTGSTLSAFRYKLVNGAWVFAFDDKTDSYNLPSGHSLDPTPGTITFTPSTKAVFPFLNEAAPEGPLKGALDIFFIGRSDGYYRVPRSDTYYVVEGAHLWFVQPATHYYGSRWVDDANMPLVAGQPYTSANWDWLYEGGFNKFTVKAPAGTDFEIKSEDNLRTLTVHVVDPATFSFRAFDVRFDGRETRSLQTLLFALNVELPPDTIAAVTASDGRISITSTGTDWQLTATDDFDNDCEVTVKLADNSGIILLKITTMPGKLLASTISRDGPPVTLIDMPIVILADDGTTKVNGADWETYPDSVNTPPGYTYVWRSANSVLYLGRRYSVCVACDRNELGSRNSTVLGYLRGGMKYNCINIAWIEDENGKKVVLPQVMFVDAQGGTPEHMYFGKGRDDKFYSNITPKHDQPYGGPMFPNRDDYSYMGTMVDEYGYYVVIERNANQVNWEEWAVIGLGGVKPVRVKKSVVGAVDDTTEFRFRAVYTDVGNQVVTNNFTLRNDEEYTVLANTNGPVTVTEVFSGAYRPMVKGPDDVVYREGNELTDGGRETESTFLFRNVGGTELIPKSLWIADHADAGENKIHLALAMDFGVSNFPMADWIAAARSHTMIFETCSTNADDLVQQNFTPVTEFRDGTGTQDADKGWVWVTTDTTAAQEHGRLYRRFAVDVSPIGYSDDTIRSTLPTAAIERFETADGVGYSIANVVEGAEITFTRPTRCRSLLLVGGGGAGGGGLGGGGGGGEVKIVPGDELGVFGVGDTLTLSIGAGGRTPAVDTTKSTGDTDNPIYNLPGENGQTTFVTLHGDTYTAQGGGGGGAHNSYVTDSAGRRGRGMDGANSGGNAGRPSASTGMPTVAGGHCGGLGKGNAGYGAGGGGGMTADGANGKSDQSGAGGEGRFVQMGNASGVYGSGGGGGCDSDTKPGAGGTNAGAGGTNVASDVSLRIGRDGVPGFGGGGGGGSYLSSTYYRGGAGGSGRVVLLVRDASAFDAASHVLGASPSGITVSCDLHALIGGAQAAARVYFSCVPVGEPANEQLVNPALAVGTSVTNYATGLQPLTDYACRYRFVAPDGSEAVVEETVRTGGIDYEAGFSDGNLVVSAAGLGPDGVQVSEGGVYTVTFTNSAQAAQLLANNELELLQALVVGGGGGGGSCAGGGGGGGEVRVVSEPCTLPMGTTGLIAVGAGGTGAPADRAKIGTAGGETTLTIGCLNIVAAGGGYGASRDNSAGGSGAQGGGAAGKNGTPGESTLTAGGHRGGNVAATSSTSVFMGGGGGGAGEDGQDAYELDGLVHAGKGGEGVTLAISGVDVVYGSGGGAGCDNLQTTTNGVGGVNAGIGGNYRLGSNYRAGGKGLDGSGAGGGGGASNGTTAYAGGKGGTGTVILKLRPRHVNE